MVEHPAVNGRVAGSSPAPGGQFFKAESGGFMRRVWITSLLVGTVPAFALAVGNHPMAGCGLGYLLLGNHNQTKPGQILAATTNDTYGIQTFGIISGTSGCTEDGAVKLVRQTEVYAEVNFDSLRREMAEGHGEFVETFATLLGATDATRPALLKFFQAHYQTLFPSPATPPDQMLQILSFELARHQELLG
jgi:hypothetical protein